MCSKANALIQYNRVNNKARRTRTMRCLTHGPVFNATAHKQPIVSTHHWQAAHPNSSSKAHTKLLAKPIMHVKTIRVHELDMALLHEGAFVLKLSVFKLFNLKLLGLKTPATKNKALLIRWYALHPYTESLASRSP